MKPDGLATEPSEPMEAEAIQLEAEPTVNEGATQNGTTASPSQPDEPQNGKEAPSTGKDVPVDSKGKSKGPVKSKTTTAGPGPGTKPRITQSRVANGTAKPAASSATKKPIAATNATAEKKPSSAVGVPKNKPAGPSTLGPRAQPKVTTVGTSRTTTTTTVTSGTKTKTAVSTANTLSKRPATASASAAAKPKSTAPAPRPNTAKPSTSTTAKTTTAPKTNRTIGSSTQRPSTTSATSKTSTTTSTATTTTTTTASRTNRTTAQPIKPLVTASTTRKDAGKTATTAPAKKPVAAVTSRPAASKPLNSEAPKTAAATKRPMPSIKPPHPKQDDKKSVPTRKVPPSPRNTSSRPTSGKTAAASTGRSTTATGKLSASKPTQSVLPLVKGKQTDKEPAVQSLQLSVAAVSITTAAAIATEESVSGSEANPIAESSHDVPASTSPDVPASSSLDVPASLSIGVPTSSSLDVLETIDVPVLTTNDDTEPPPQDELVEAGLVEVSDARPTTPEGIQELDEQDSEKVDEKLNIAVAPVAQETVMQKTVTASLFDNPATTVVPSAGLEVAEKADGINIECCEEVEEEEREGSQQVSLSEMSGTQPTEESRPGSVGPSGSIWRAGALLSELDSEDVSCSQQGASELSAPGVLEGTESMDDLGDASLKGAEGASVGSPDFEKVPDILTNEEDEDDDEDDDDRVYDMDVGSERAEDSHRQHHEDEEDEDVEMASEGITESGLESYGNADEDDLTEDYRLDNLNRIQPPSVDMSVFPGAPWNQPSCFSDPWAQLPQPASTLLSSPSSEHCQADAETPTQAHAQATLDVSNSESGPSSPYGPNLLEAPSCSSQSPPSTAEEDVCPKQVLTPQDCETELGTFNAPELGFDSKKDTSKPEDVNDDSCLVNVISKIDHQPEQLNAVLPEIVQDLGVHFECANEEEEQETFPADDLLGGPATAPASVPSSSSSATEDEASDTEGEMQISDPQEEQPVTEAAPVTHNLSALEEREEISGEIEGGGSDTSQSATSAASYGFDYMTSNSNAQSSAESCSKSPGIFSLENEEQLLDEAKDTSLFKELTLIPTPAVGEEPEFLQSQHVEFQSHLEQQYMLCGESSELKKPDLPPQVATSQSGLNDSSSPQHLEEPDLETPHPYYSTICENTDSSMAGNV